MSRTPDHSFAQPRRPGRLALARPAAMAVAAALAASLLGGCTVGPDYRPADSPLAPNYAS
ncbi:TolC family protein, partial [Burkholderia sp. Ap-962]|nr:TolC family protein [Burkholderia sp. Ap-962]